MSGKVELISSRLLDFGFSHAFCVDRFDKQSADYAERLNEAMEAVQL